METSYLEPEQREEQAGGLLVFTGIFALTGGLLGFILAYQIVHAKRDGRPRYRRQDRETAQLLQWVALASTLLWVGIRLMR